MRNRMVRKIMFWGFDYPLAVTKGAAHLKVSEEELFAIAYRGWHKQEADPEEMQRCYREFLCHAFLPHWVKHYVRQLDARTHFMNDDLSSNNRFFWGWLTKLLIVILLPNSTNLVKQLLLNQKYSLHC